MEHLVQFLVLEMSISLSIDAQEDQDCSEMEAMVATPEDLQNCCWFPDSRATNHVTHDLGNLNYGAEYNAQSSHQLDENPSSDIRFVQQDLSNTDSSSTMPILNESASISSSSNLYDLPGKIPLSTNSNEPNESINTRPVTLPQQPHHMVTRKQSLIPNGKKQWTKNLEFDEEQDLVFGFSSKYKAHLVAKGYSQVPGFDFSETFSPVVKPTTIRVVLVVVVSQADQSLFVRFANYSSLFVFVYVDDIVVTRSSSQEIHELISRLSGLFSLKDLGELSYFLGMRSVVGALQYITITRPEIAFSVNKVCQFMQKPLDTHWKAVKQILRYLNGTTDLGIVLKPSETMNLMGFCDTDWGNDVGDRKSLLSELQTKMTMVPVIWCDNISIVSLSANPFLHSRTKHMELDLYFVLDKLCGKLTITSLDLKNGD
ncbi:Retrovirus-related Pol polyprotein from transposon RE1 [Vitis vinifera]|uniref:Retrovirus-related Pol polyprotein from transposon RE1 n=1 Tax=Vitis vinifera TaxID=29760 RepID=A0A438HA36_VITVI|nr:Retrovirus-related Pol polyprotein from transposon RE1 [Vitis vinifera]